MNNTNFKNKKTEEHGAHMTPRVSYVLEKANDVSLTHEEKTHGAHIFKQFIEGKINEKEALKLRRTSKKIKSPYFYNVKTLFTSASMSFKKKVLVPLVAILIFSFAGGTALAANESLPGDVLYPIKININEKIEALIASPGKAKAKVAAEHAINRLEEAERLAEKGRLHSIIQAELTQSFVSNTKRVDEENDDDKSILEIKADFESSLESHHRLIKDIENRSDKNKEMLNGISQIVKLRLDEKNDKGTSSPKAKNDMVSKVRKETNSFGNTPARQTALIKGDVASTTNAQEAKEGSKDGEE